MPVYVTKDEQRFRRSHIKKRSQSEGSRIEEVPEPTNGFINMIKRPLHADPVEYDIQECLYNI